MSSPDSAFCHHHSVTASTENNHFIQSRSTSLFSSTGHEQGFRVSFQKKTQPNKNIKANKNTQKKIPTTTKNSVDCSYFLPSLSRKLVFLPFFHSPIPTTGSPSKTSSGSPSLSSHQTLLGLLMCCAAGPIPHLGSRRPFRRRRGNLLQSHYIVCYRLVLTSPIPADQQPHRAPSTTDILRPHEKLQGAFLTSRYIRFPAKLFNSPVSHPQCFPS